MKKVTRVAKWTAVVTLALGLPVAGAAAGVVALGLASVKAAGLGATVALAGLVNFATQNLD